MDRIRIERRIKVDDSAMGPDAAWRADDPVYAQVIFVSAKALPQYQQVQGVVYWRIEFHGSVDIGLKDTRFVWLNKGGKILLPVEPPRVLETDTVILVKEQ